MNAIVQHQYGPPEILQLKGVATPAPSEGEVLVRIHAASVNPMDWHLSTGTPFLVRLFAGLRRPRQPTPGSDLAGVVEAIGPGAKDFKPGDAVFGAARGAYAEYACVSEDRLAPKPVHVPSEQAATVAVAGLTVLQAFRAAGGIRADQRVLINGASGGVGTFAVQYARSCGAEVTGVCSTRNVEMVRSIGAAHVIDYTREDFTRSGARFDLIFDAVGHRSPAACRRVLKPQGVYVTVAVGSKANSLAILLWMLRARLAFLFARQKMVTLTARVRKQDLVALGDLLAAGKIAPVIDRRFTGLAQVPDLLRHQGAGHARGKSVVTIVPGD